MSIAEGHIAKNSATQEKRPFELLVRVVQETPQIRQAIATALICLPKLENPIAEDRTYFVHRTWSNGAGTGLEATSLEG